MASPTPSPSEQLGGVTWGDIGYLLWITAAVYGGLVLVALAWDVSVSVREGRRFALTQSSFQKMTHLRHLKGAGRPPQRRRRIRALLQPYRVRFGVLLELVTLVFSCVQLIEYFVRSYSTRTGEIGLGGFVLVAIINGFFIARYVAKLLLWERGLRLSYVTGFLPTIEVVTIVSALLSETQIVDTYLSLTYLRVIVVYFR